MIILKTHIIVSYDQNISLIFLCERWIPCQASKSVLCLHYRPVTVDCSTKDAYTFETTFLALVLCLRVCFCREIRKSNERTKRRRLPRYFHYLCIVSLFLCLRFKVVEPKVFLNKIKGLAKTKNIFPFWYKYKFWSKISKFYNWGF